MTSSRQAGAYRLEFIPRAQRSAEKIGQEYGAVNRKIDALRDNPRPRGALKLRGNTYRIRSGVWRVIYDIDDRERLVTVIDILRREKDTYRHR